MAAKHMKDSYSMLDVSHVPEVPGIYAWYVRFSASEQDWQFQPSVQGDAAIPQFEDIIHRFGEQFQPPALKLHAKGAYQTKWDGELVLDYPFRGNQSETTTPSAVERRAIKQATETPRARRVVANILQRATPTFSAPLYIGVAEDLRVRLSQHQEDYNRAYDYIKAHPEDRERLQISGKNFGTRAAARDIAIEHLEVWVIALDDESRDIPTHELREIAESAEWILHRIYGPILGRR